MHRKDYEVIAKVIKGMPGFISGTTTTRNPYGAPIKELVFDNFTSALKAVNGNFKPDKFRKACGL